MLELTAETRQQQRFTSHWLLVLSSRSVDTQGLIKLTLIYHLHRTNWSGLALSTVQHAVIMMIRPCFLPPLFSNEIVSTSLLLTIYSFTNSIRHRNIKSSTLFPDPWQTVFFHYQLIINKTFVRKSIHLCDIIPYVIRILLVSSQNAPSASSVHRSTLIDRFYNSVNLDIILDRTVHYALMYSMR